MKQKRRALAGAALGVSMVMGSSLPAFAGDAPDTQTPATGPTLDQAAQNQTVADGHVRLASVAGMFSYDQSTITPNSIIAQMFRKATATICNATDDFVAANPLGWQLSVSGDVGNAFTMDVGALASEESVKKVMTCSCGGNPADGAVIITAEVKGVPLYYLLSKSQASKDANTATFIASDGTKVAIPLGYAIGRHAVISYEINGEDLSASVGGNNQLWMTRTPANYFIRDIVEIRFTKEAAPPANPGENDVHPNSPNVGFLTGLQ
jgi:DMSO/TMAO reductase YedYZ molybdopterin-dependent catalytic subunit